MRSVWVTLLVILLGSATYASEGEVSIAYPDEDGQRIEAQSTFVFGSAPPHAAVWVNGVEAFVEPELGAYLAVIDLDLGSNAIEVRASWAGGESVAERKVVVPGPWETTDSSEGPRIEVDRILPKDDLVVSVGDEVRVFIKGSPGAAVTFSIPGLRENLPMVELDHYPAYIWGEGRFGDGTNATHSLAVDGIYVGSYIVQPEDQANGERVTFDFQFQDDEFSVPAPGRITTMDPAVPRVLAVTASQAPVYAATGSSFNGMNWTWLGSGFPVAPLHWQPQGVRMQWVGQEGEYFRVRLSSGKEFWIHRGDVQLLPRGTPLPQAQLPAIRTHDNDRSSIVRFYMTEAMPVEVHYQENPHGVQVVIHNALWHQDSVFYDHKSTWLTELQVRQAATNRVEVWIGLEGNRLDGYTLAYEGSDLIVTLRQPPKVVRGNPLQGRILVVDPGHGGARDQGGTGPTGIHEKDVVLPISLLLADRLHQAGATVHLTRATDEATSLAARRQLAEDVDADLLLSVHANAFPDGIDSTVHHGHSTIYTYPFHAPAAKALQNALLEGIGFPNYGIQRRGNLAVLRNSTRPSVLVEMGFMMHPVELAFMLSQNGQEQLAEALFQGIWNYFEDMTN